MSMLRFLLNFVCRFILCSFGTVNSKMNFFFLFFRDNAMQKGFVCQRQPYHISTKHNIFSISLAVEYRHSTPTPNVSYTALLPIYITEIKIDLGLPNFCSINSSLLVMDQTYAKLFLSLLVMYQSIVTISFIPALVDMGTFQYWSGTVGLIRI